VSKPNHRRHPRRWLFRFGRGKLAAEVEMPLKDHFHPPLKDRPAFTSVHAMWATQIVSRLNLQVLSNEYVSQAELKLGPSVEIDVATLDTRTVTEKSDRNGAVEDEGGVAVAVERKTDTAPSPGLSAPLAVYDPDVFEIRVLYDIEGWKLVAAIELVSEANKDRPEHRRALATKVAGYIQKGISAVVVDIVTNRTANFHAEIAGVMKWPDELGWESATDLSAVSYRTIRRNKQVQLDVWPQSLAVGKELPTLPLWLAADVAVPLELEPTYTEACRSLRVR
jgi:hypothetical protein